MKVFLVGGAVRDALLNLPVRERDWVVVGASPEMMIESGFKPIGKDFPVFLHPETKEEYALARTERKTGRGYHGFNFYSGADVTLEEDLQRRDLTINAIAQDAQGNLIDPVGGQNDLSRKILRHVSSAFVEDPVRVLRIARFLARFEALGFCIADETVTLMRKMSSAGEVSALVPERVWREIKSSLVEPSPAAFFCALKQADALEIMAPELDVLFGNVSSVALLTGALNSVAQTGKPEVVFAVLISWAAAEGLELDDWCAQLKVPMEYRRLAKMMPQLYGLIQTSAVFDAASLLEFFKRNDLLRNPKRFRIPVQFWQHCALSEHLPGYRAVGAAEFVQSALQAVVNGNFSTVIQQQDDPQAIKAAVYAAQLKILADLIDSLSE